MTDHEFDPPQEDAVEVPYTKLPAHVLRNLAEEFVTRDGTDYGREERSLDEKVNALMGELREGRARIFFEANSGTVHIVASHELQRRQREE